MQPPGGAVILVVVVDEVDEDEEELGPSVVGRGEVETEGPSQLLREAFINGYRPFYGFQISFS